MRSEYGVNLIAIKRKVMDGGVEQEKWNVNPHPEDVIYKGDLLVLVGSNNDLKKL